MLQRLLSLLFPPKCVLCKKLLTGEEADLCHTCRTHTPEFTKGKFKLSFVAQWTAVWYYKDTVRQSLLRYKFYGRRSYAPVYGRLLAMKLQTARLDDFDVLTWVPVSRLRRWVRGFDQTQLLADAMGRETGTIPVMCLKKIRHTPPQSGIKTPAARRANVLGAYRVTDPQLVLGKRVLLLDDIVTTGATASECARVLLTTGAKEVCVACVAATHYENTKKAI